MSDLYPRLHWLADTKLGSTRASLSLQPANWAADVQYAYRFGSPHNQAALLRVRETVVCRYHFNHEFIFAYACRRPTLESLPAAAQLLCPARIFSLRGRKPDRTRRVQSKVRKPEPGCPNLGHAPKNNLL